MSGCIRFGVYELDPDALELHKHGVPVRLQEQPLQVLTALLERPGEIVSREQLQERIWGKDTFVDFDQSLNKAVNRLREALNDDPARPRFVETVPRRGYRFVAPVDPVANPTANQASANTSSPPPLDFSAAKPWIHWVRSSPRRIAVIVGTLALLAGTTAYLLLRSSVAPPEQITVVPFTTYPGAEMNPSFSPDGNQIAFAWTGGEASAGAGVDLYVKQMGSEQPLRLTTQPAVDLWPAWSPDGRFIAFTRTTANSRGIYLIPALGGAERKLADLRPADAESWYDQLSWSPDGKWLAFADPENEHATGLYGARAYLLNLETLEKQRIPDPSPQCVSTWRPAFSPDGKNLAVACELSVALNLIYVQPSASGPARKVAQAEGNFIGLTWTANGKDLIYSANFALWRVPAQGGSAEQLLYAQDAISPAVAHAGKRMAYSRLVSPGDVWRVDLAAPARPVGTAEKVVTSSYGQWGAHISPDGRKIAFNSDRSGTNEIWVCDSDGSNAVQLTYFTRGALGVPQWSPDSHRVAFDINADGPDVHTYTMRVDGGAPQRLATGTRTDSHPSWSVDGRWIYFDQWKDRLGIWKVAVEGGQPIRLTNDNGVFPQESADGKRVFYVNRWEGAVLWSAATTGGDEHAVEGMPTLVAGWHWGPAPSGIYFIDGGTRPATLNLFDPSDHQVRRIGSLLGPATYWGVQLSISRDGHTLVYTDADRNEADIMLVDGFR